MAGRRGACETLLPSSVGRAASQPQAPSPVGSLKPGGELGLRVFSVTFMEVFFFPSFVFLVCLY